MKDYMFLSDTGDLYDTRQPDWSKLPPLRPRYRYHHSEIKTISHLKASLRAGPYTTLGSYPVFFVTKDGGTLTYKTVKAEFKTIVYSMSSDSDKSWQIMGCAVNWESELYDDHTGERIESAYGDE